MDHLKKGEVKYITPPTIYHLNKLTILPPPTAVSEPPCALLSRPVPLPPSLLHQNPPSHPGPPLLTPHTHPQNGHQFQRRRDPRRRQSNNYRRLYREPRHGQTNTSARHDLVLSVRVRGRHAGGGGHCALPSGHVRDQPRRGSDDADGRRSVSGAVL